MHTPRSPSHTLQRVAGWLSYGLHAAFFTSLDRCSCVKLDTIDFDYMDKDGKARPLLRDRSSRESGSRPHQPRISCRGSGKRTKASKTGRQNAEQQQLQEEDEEDQV